MRRIASTSLVLAIAMVAGVGPLLAETPGESAGAAAPVFIGAQAPDAVVQVVSPAPDWGTTVQAMQKTGINEFRYNDSTHSLAVTLSGTAIYYFQNAPTTSSDWWAEMRIPSGAIVDSVELDACDTSATGAIQFGAARVPAGAGGGGNVTPVGSTGTAATPGCGIFSVAPTSTLVIDNGAYNYWFFIDWSGDYTGTVKAATFRVKYRLQVSPAPGVASFTDVPTSYWAFQYIEALKASGITGGVTPTTFEPESNVTRAQMAVFLAKALGLHFPN